MRRAAALSVAFALSACGGGAAERPADEATAPQAGGALTAAVASFDLAAGHPSRFLVGLGTGQNLFIGGGTVDLSFSFLGEERASGAPQPYRDATATFLPLYGEEGPFPATPVAAPSSRGRGVYVVEEFEFDRPGIWEVEVSADVQDRGTLTGTTAFEVRPEPIVPTRGDPAPRTDNLVLGDRDAPPEAVDSRATTGDIPDPELHETTISDSIRAARPVLVVISTPVYCQSRFCGPVTDLIQELAAEYGDRAHFVHLEVWRDFQEGVINEPAAEWIYRENELQEPWVFLVGADGRIVERWDNVATRGEIEPFLQDLPVL